MPEKVKYIICKNERRLSPFEGLRKLIIINLKANVDF